MSNNKLQEIHNLLPDNDNAEITEGKVREAFSKTFDFVTEQNTTQDTAISGKLDKTTATISEPNAEFKYAYLTNEANQTRRMLAGDLGKNVANSKPTSVAGAGLNMGAIWEIATNGFPLRIRGLANKKSDPSFIGRLIVNQYGELAFSDEEEVRFIFPEKFTATLNVNHIYPVNVPSRPAFADDLQSILGNLKNYDFKVITKNEWNLIANDSIKNSQILRDNGDFIIRSINNQGVTLLAPNEVLPIDKDWILRINIGYFEDTLHGTRSTSFGIVQELETVSMKIGVVAADHTSACLFPSIKTIPNIPNDGRRDITVFIIKTGSVITTIAYSVLGNVIHSQGVVPEFGNYIPKVYANNNFGARGRMMYKILN